MARLALGLLLLALAAGGAGAQEVIHRFEAVVEVARDGTLTVSERIAVRAEGRAIRRGIYRDFPLTFRDPEGNLRQVTFELVEVRRDGKPEPHFTRRSFDGIRIYAGSENVLLPRGDHAYRFVYRTGRQIRWLDEGAELFWNVTGNEWTFPIQHASVRVVLEGGARPDRWTAYTGRLGARGTDWRGEVEADGALVVETTRPLAAREGFSVVLALPPGAVEPPSEVQKLLWLFHDYRSWIFAGLGLALVLAFYSYAWNAVGRDPKGGTVIPLFHPPEDMSPALTNYVHNWGLGRDQWRAFTAASLSLAVRGLIRFDEQAGGLTLRATGREPKDRRGQLPPGERAILDWVRSQGGVAAIERKNGAAVAKIGKEFKARIENENRHKFFRKNLGYFFAGLALTACVIVGVLVFGGLREGDYLALFFMAFASIWIGLLLIPLVRTIYHTLTGGGSFHAALVAAAVLTIFVFFASHWLAALPGVAEDVLPFFLAALKEHSFPFALVFAFAAVNGLFLYLLRAPTDLGREVMDKIEGLRLYLQTAESARLNMNAPEISAERFEALLPYAVALGVEKPWAEAFAAALRRARPAEPAPAYRPAWASGGNWSGSNIGRAVSSSVTAATGAFASAAPPPSSGSSGFSGGGGSGGGGGGGGGGGW